MKANNRIHKNNTAKTPPVQPSIGHKDAISGHRPHIDGLDENQKTAINILAKRYGKTPKEYCNTAINGVLKTSVDDVVIQLRDGSPEEKKTALSLLRSLPEPFRPLQVDINLATPAPGIIPKSLRDEAKAALDELNGAGLAAMSLLMMAAHTILEEVASNEPKHDDLHQWRRLVELNFEGGIYDLVIDEVSRYKDAMEQWQIEQLSLLAGQPGLELKANLENEVYCLNTLNRYLGNILSNHYSHSNQSAGALLLCWRVCENLNDAFMKSFTMIKLLNDAAQNSAAPQSLKQAA